MGVSRSSAAVLAYLMLRHQMTAVEALIEVKSYPCFFNVEIMPYDPRLERSGMFDQMTAFFASWQNLIIS